MRSKIRAVSLFAAVLVLIAPYARAEQDAVQFFHNFEVTPDAPVGDGICFFCNVHVEGKVEGDIVVFFGSVYLNGDASHDVVDFFGKVAAAD
ncbi:MAG TPA: hypothetical protein VG672_01125, partial [Bryobacteraceae bacterium]|nr:hypothetical protein [Bryobacteraceae bacterium]